MRGPLVVASMACLFVWKLERDSSPEAEELRTVLVRLSGRQMKRTQPFTAPALLAGFWVLLAFLDILESYTVAELHRLAELTLHQTRDGPEKLSKH